MAWLSRPRRVLVVAFVSLLMWSMRPGIEALMSSIFRCNKNGSCGDGVHCLEAKDFTLRRIRNSEVEHELAFARAGSTIPSILHGIFWMDQRGVSVREEIARIDPGYQQVGSWAADELLVAFGGTRFNNITRCIPVLLFGESWTWMDQGGGENYAWTSARDTFAYLDFCFRSDTFEVADIHVYLKFFGLWFRVPWFVMHAMVKKTKWGIDRHTTLIFGLLHFHYPVLRIVDGNGARTRYYKMYEQWANNSLSSDHPSIPTNKGNGTSLTGHSLTGRELFRAYYG